MINVEEYHVTWPCGCVERVPVTDWIRVHNFATHRSYWRHQQGTAQ